MDSLKGRSGSAPYTRESRKELRIHCRRQECKCTHTYPCEAGWIEVDNGGVAGCQNCHPEVRALARTVEGDREELQRRVRDPQARQDAQALVGWD